MSEFDFWKSSYSEPNGECVEVALNVQGAVAVRDSKGPDGPVLAMAPAAWDRFIADLRRQS